MKFELICGHFTNTIFKNFTFLLVHPLVCTYYFSQQHRHHLQTDQPHHPVQGDLFADPPQHFPLSCLIFS